jgi:hypothetical protein
LSKAWNGEDGEDRQVMWLLESSKDRILGVDTLGQQVSPRVRHGMTFLVIKNTISCVSYSDDWGMECCFRLGSTWCKRGLRRGGSLALQAGPVVGILSTASMTSM